VDERDQIARQREDFVSRLTHDLRTPLVAADRMMSLLTQGAMGDLSAEVAEALDVMSRSNGNLLTLVNTLLEVYRYEAGRKTLNFTAVNLPTLAQEVVEELSSLAIHKDLHLELVKLTGPEQGLIVRGDRLELRRVLTNLVGNAIKFTDNGSVKVLLTTGLSNPNAVGGMRPLVKLAVQDTGPGIPPQEHGTLFESFTQGQHKRSGSGLGLHLSRRIMEAHEGTIGLTSEIGRGSTFTVALPAH
jgi:two-component system, sensor histidine kinase and response regulator